VLLRLLRRKGFAVDGTACEVHDQPIWPCVRRHGTRSFR
jgi:hypothetical protein